MAKAHQWFRPYKLAVELWTTSIHHWQNGVFFKVEKWQKPKELATYRGSVTEVWTKRPVARKVAQTGKAVPKSVYLGHKSRHKTSVRGKSGALILQPLAYVCEHAKLKTVVC